MTCSARTTPARSTASRIEELTPRMFSLQQSLRRLRDLHRPGHLYEGGPGADHSQQAAFPSGEGAIKASGWYYAEGSISADVLRGAWARNTALRWTPRSRRCPTKVCTRCCTVPAAKSWTMHRETDQRHRDTTTPILKGIINNLERRFRETNSEWMKEEIARLHDRHRMPRPATATA